MSSHPNGRIDAAPTAEADRDKRDLTVDKARSNLTVAPTDDGWTVTGTDGQALGLLSTKAEAVKLAREHAVEGGFNVTIKKSDGSVQETITPRA